MHSIAFIHTLTTCTFFLLTVEQQPKPSKSDPSAARPSVTDLIDELSEVEHQVGGGKPIERSTSDGTNKRTNITASTATFELDQLMQNLEAFEPPDSNKSVIYFVLVSSVCTCTCMYACRHAATVHACHPMFEKVHCTCMYCVSV